MRSLLYGGKAPECTTIINNSTLVEALCGKVLASGLLLFLLNTFAIAAAGYVTEGEGGLGEGLLLYDGAGTRIHVGPKVTVKTPPARFQDGAQLEVGSYSSPSQPLMIRSEEHW